MPRIIELAEIKTILHGQEERIIDAIEDGFRAYSKGEVVVPPVGEMSFQDPPGDSHIKYGFIRHDDHYVIKIASIFYENRKRGLSPNNGLMLVMEQATGSIAAILLDQGYLTQLRTAAAGAVVARYLAPRHVEQIGIYGAGIQGQLQAAYLKHVLDCRRLMVWGVNPEELTAYQRHIEPLGYDITTTMDPAAVAACCNFIVTATPSRVPIFQSDFLCPGMHVTAMGSDTPTKQELDTAVLRRADIVVADSVPQSRHRGEIHHALKAGAIGEEQIVELGAIIDHGARGRCDDAQITIADLTGVAVQDIKIADLVCQLAH